MYYEDDQLGTWWTRDTERRYYVYEEGVPRCIKFNTLKEARAHKKYLLEKRGASKVWIHQSTLDTTVIHTRICL